MEQIQGDYQFHALHHGHPVQRAWHRNKLEIIRHVAPPPKGALVLDAGCGSGVISNFLVELGANVIGVDINCESIKFAIKKYQRKGLTFVCESILEFKGGPFDFIYLIECIEHFHRTYALRLLRHLREMAKPNGKIFLTTPNYMSTWLLIEQLMDLLHLTPRLWKEQHLFPQTPGRLTKVLEMSGWQIIEMGTFNGISPFLEIISSGLGSLFFSKEIRHRHRRFRNLLYAYCQKS